MSEREFICLSEEQGGYQKGRFKVVFFPVASILLRKGKKQQIGQNLWVFPKSSLLLPCVCSGKTGKYFVIILPSEE